MSKLSRVIVLVVGLMSVFAALAGAASATTWTNAGDTAFTATTGPSTLSSGSATLSCTSGSATGTATTPQVSTTYTVSGNLTYSSCRLGLLTTTVSCTYALTGNSISAGVTSGTVAVNLQGQRRGLQDHRHDPRQVHQRHDDGQRLARRQRVERPQLDRLHPRGDGGPDADPDVFPIVTGFSGPHPRGSGRSSPGCRKALGLAQRGRHRRPRCEAPWGSRNQHHHLP